MGSCKSPDAPSTREILTVTCSSTESPVIKKSVVQFSQASKEMQQTLASNFEKLRQEKPSKNGSWKASRMNNLLLINPEF
jgi:hypothetical protein